MAETVRGRERDDVVAAAVVAGCAGAREAHDAALGHPLQISRVDRSVGGDDDHARAAGALGRRGGDGHSGDGQVAAEIRLHQHADRVAVRRAAGRRADAAFESERDRPGAGADGAFLDRAAARRLDRVKHLIPPDGTGADVVQRAVVRLRDERVDRAHLLVPRQRQHVVEQRVGHARHVQRRGQEDRRLDLAELLDLCRPRDLAEAVADEDRARHFLLKEAPAVRQHRGHAGADGLAADDGGVPDADAGDVGDGVERPRLERADDDAHVPRARPRLGGRRRGGDGGSEERAGNEHARHRRT